MSAGAASAATPPPLGATGVGFQGVHHVAVICANLEASLAFYCGTLGAAFARSLDAGALATHLLGAELGVLQVCR